MNVSSRVSNLFVVRIALFVCTLTASVASPAALSTLDLANYTHTATYDLSTTRSLEASAVTWNADTGTLFVVGDAAQAVAQYSVTGALLNYMTMTNFTDGDAEGLTWIGNNEFVIAMESVYDAKLMTYTAGGTLSGSGLPTASLFSTTDVVYGLEGVSYDPSSGRYFFIEEKTPVAIYSASLNFSPPISATVHSTLTLNIAGVTDISDIQALSTVMQVGSPDFNNLLVLSHEGHRVMELDRNTGAVLSQFLLTGIVGQVQPEGVTIDANGVIYIVDEGPGGTQPKLFVLSPPPVVPAPSATDDGPVPVTEGVAAVIPVGTNDTGFTDPVTVTVTTPPAKGTIGAISIPGAAAGMTITYTTNIGATGADSFVYDMTDSTPASDSATVTVDISPDTDGDGVPNASDNCMLVDNPGQLDADSDGYGNLCDGDLNNNGATNTQDYGIFRTHLGTTTTPPAYDIADLNGNGIVNNQDYGFLRSLLGSSPGPSGLACAGTIPCP